jgi:hypothetical protein
VEDLDVNRLDSEGMSCFAWAFQEGHVDVMLHLVTLPKIVIPREFFEEPDPRVLVEAVRRDLVGPKVKIDGQTLAQYLIKTRNHDGLRVLVAKKDYNMNAYLWGTTALRLAIQSRSIETVGILLSSPKIDVNESTKKVPPPLIQAIEDDDPRFFELLIAHPKIDPNVKTWRNETPLIWAIAEKKVDFVKALLRFPDLDVNVRDADRRTALQMVNRRVVKEPQNADWVQVANEIAERAHPVAEEQEEEDDSS